ncbi:MAG: hypothetical protein A2X86_10045 [Bdellovibrionales bacterium GWA2_49_15]|nr:MAG: hypothetical protein A2X86_10045 [Bdellovibrionales bacterium GWA2_49_15]
MVAAGVLGILSLGVLHLITNMMKSKDDFQSRVDQLAARIGVERVLADYRLCATALHGENGKGIQLDQINQEALPDQERPERELSKKYIVTSIQPFQEVLLEEGKSFSGITVGKISLDKILIGSNPTRHRFRLNLNVPLLDSKSKEVKKSLNWPIEVRVDSDDNNLIVKCQLHFLDSPHDDNSRVECVNWGFDSRGMDTGLCSRGTQGGFAITKASPSGDKDNGVGATWRRADFAIDHEIYGCAALPTQDSKLFITGVCWGEGLWLIKSIGPTEHEKQEIKEKTFISHRVKNKEILGCLSVPSLDGKIAQSGVCWGDGLYLIKTTAGKEGIELDWNVATHLPDVMFTSCILQDYHYSPTKGQPEWNILCTSMAGIAFVKLGQLDSVDGDKGISLPWRATLHD